MRGAGVEPHVENVVFLAPLPCSARAFRAWGKQLFRRVLIPGVSAFFFKPFDDAAESGEILQLLAAAIAEKHDDGHAPETLAGNAPVRALFDHFVHAVFTPTGNPLHAMNFCQRFFAEGVLCAMRSLVHFDEPLLGGAENDRVVAAPVVRVTMLIRMMSQQGA